jgi:hypothetical protein
MIDSHGDRRWVVEALLDHREPPRKTDSYRSSPPEGKIDPSREYLVRWRGYPPDQDTWESRVRLLEDVPDLVESYEAAGRSRPTRAETKRRR